MVCVSYGIKVMIMFTIQNHFLGEQRSAVLRVQDLYIRMSVYFGFGNIYMIYEIWQSDTISVRYNFNQRRQFQTPSFS